jgi:hypothetical protein
MQHVHHQFNFLAILVSAVFIWLLGALWYSSVLFAKPWSAIIGRPMGDKPKGLVKGMVSSLIGDLLLSLVLDHFVIWSHADNFGHGAFIGLLSWVGFVVSPLYPQSVYEGRPFQYFAINAGYWLISLVVVGGLLAVWR